MYYLPLTAAPRSFGTPLVDAQPLRPPLRPAPVPALARHVPAVHRRFLNRFLRRAVTRWRLRGVLRIPPHLFFQFGNRQLLLPVFIHQALYHRLDVARQHRPFGFGQTFDRWLLRTIHGRLFYTIKVTLFHPREHIPQAGLTLEAIYDKLPA